MKRYVIFVGVGSLFATVEEFLTVAVLKGDVGAYVFTLLILFPVFLTIVWLMRQFVINRLIHDPANQNLCHLLGFGFVGLMMEWFLMKLAPWNIPEAHPVLMLAMLVLQIGMFAFWSTVAFAPTLFIDDDELRKTTRKALLRFYIPYFAIVYLIAAVGPKSAKPVILIPLIIFGYVFLYAFYIKFLRRLAPIPEESA